MIGVLVLVIGGVVLVCVGVVVMIKMNQSQQRLMERRRQEWVAQGGRPEDEPHFGYFGRTPDSGGTNYMGG